MRNTRSARAGARWVVSTAAALALVAGLAGCSAGGPLVQQYNASGDKSFSSGDMQVHEYAPQSRPHAVHFTGILDNGKTVASADYLGEVTVVNFWYAACAPCRAEAPRLEKAYQSFTGKKVAFLGVNTYDQPATALSFEKDHGVTYPSVIDMNDGKAVTAAFADVPVPLTATPTTVVLDAQGRPAARIVGELPSSSILVSLIQDALDGKS